MICNPKQPGMGAYPSDSYYDPARPSWLPYWIDTPTESGLKWGAYPGVTTMENPPLPPAPVSPIVPSGGSTGSVTDPGAVENVLAGTWENQQLQTQQFFTQLEAEEEQRRKKNEKLANLRTWGIVAVGGILLAVFLKGSNAK